jgi:hypothetical protein
MMDVPQYKPVEPWKLPNDIGWKCTSTESGKPVVGNLLGTIEVMRQNRKTDAKLARSKLFSDIKTPLGCMYRADHHMDKDPIRNAWIKHQSVHGRVKMALYMYVGASLHATK